MEKNHSIQGIIDISKMLRESHKTIGFVPTMGALHKGHLSLIEKAKEENDIVICSIFVNPIQFNNPEDLEKYPRDIEMDSKLLEAIGCDYLFSPNQDEVYSEKPNEEFDFSGLDKVMEGKQRPGHFNGVAVIVSRLFDWIKPHRAYFGEKDFQQLAIIKAMVGNLGLDIEIIPCPIIREEDGLAMSSRNQRLSPQARAIAPKINSILRKSNSLKENISITQVKSFVINEFKLVKEFDLEYFEIVDAITLEPINQISPNGVVGCVAVSLEGVRLIDVIRYY